MEFISFRSKEELRKAAAELARLERRDQSDEYREIFSVGIAEKRKTVAIDNYSRGETSLGKSAEIAGLTVKRVINEPTAAALAYGFNKKKDEKIVVYDFGGGTFDISVLEVSEDTIEVKATGGDTHLGGDDIDQKIIAHFVEEFKKDQGVDVSHDQLALQRLKDAAEKAKHELSSTAQTEINIPFLTADASGPKHFTVTLTRARLEALTKEYIDRSIELTKKAVADAGLKMSGIH